MERKDYLDTLKSIAIFLVVFAHFEIYVPLKNLIYTFHMPLFMFLSGCTFFYNYSRQNAGNLKALTVFMLKKARALIVPYLFFVLMARFLSGFHGQGLFLPGGQPRQRKHFIMGKETFAAERVAELRQNIDFSDIPEIKNFTGFHPRYPEYFKQLAGNLNDFWECHIETDWLLLYQIFENALVLSATTTGIHADLFGR